MEVVSLVTLKPCNFIIFLVLALADAALVVMLEALRAIHSPSKVANDLTSLTSSASILCSFCELVESELVPQAAADATHDEVG